jgi:hypothetical protein
MEEPVSVLTEVVIGVGSALIGSAAGAWLAFRIEKRKYKREHERERLQTCTAACRELDNLLAEWYTAIDDAITFKETAEETIASLRRFERQPNFERRLQRILDDIRDEPGCQRLRDLAWDFRDKCLQTKKEFKETLSQGLKIRFPRGYLSWEDKDEAMAYLKKESDAFGHELSLVTDSLRKRLDGMPL